MENVQLTLNHCCLQEIHQNDLLERLHIARHLYFRDVKLEIKVLHEIKQRKLHKEWINSVH